MNPVCILSNLWTVSNVLADEKYYQMALTTKKEIAALAEALGHPMQQFPLSFGPWLIMADILVSVPANSNDLFGGIQ